MGVSNRSRSGRSVRLLLMYTLVCFLALPLGLVQANHFGQESKGDAQANQKEAERRATLNFVEQVTSRSSEGLREEKLANGGVMVNVEGRFQHVSLARKNADGSVSVECVSNAAEAAAFLDGEDETGHEHAETASLGNNPGNQGRNAASGGTSLISPTSAAATTNANPTVINIVNANAPGVGFNDPTPATPIGGNTGTTLGQQRLIAFQRAAQIWASALQTNVPISIQAQFTPLGPGVLGSAGTTRVVRDFANAPFPATFYAYALANRLAGIDVINPPVPQLNTNFSTNFDFYLGLDNNAPAGQPDLLVVLLHEFAHGFGFATFVNTANGRNIGATDADPNGGFTDAYARNLRDETLGLTWNNMTAAQRQASAINTGNLTWNGMFTNAALAGALNRLPILRVNNPGMGVPGTIDVVTAGAPATAAGLSGNIVLADPILACGPLNNAAAVNGNVAFVDRGTCAFVDKARNAQAAGARAIIIANNVAGGPTPVVATPDITIPVIGISQADGNALRAQAATGVNVTLTLDPVRRAGTTNGRIRMFAPNPRQPGSSVSHWDNTVRPRLLMEPAINPLIPQTLDLTITNFRDIGWFITGAAARADNRVSLTLNSAAAAPGVTPGCPSGYVNVITVNATLRNLGSEPLLAPISMTAAQLVKRGADLEPAVPYRLSSSDGFDCSALSGPTSGIPSVGAVIRQTTGAASVLPSSAFPQGSVFPDNGLPVQFTIAAGVVQRFFILLNVDAVTPSLTPMTNGVARKSAQPKRLGELALEIATDPVTKSPVVVSSRFIPAAGGQSVAVENVTARVAPTGATATVRR
jgi:hypothetical protein